MNDAGPVIVFTPCFLFALYWPISYQISQMLCFWR